jgi:excisionase family DNA binding protein
MTDKVLLTVREYAAEARVTERTVRRWISEGRLRALRQGKKYLIPSEESARAQLGTHGRPSLPGAAKPVGDGALKYLLFWICDAWVDGGAALQGFAKEDAQGAERYFQNLVAEIDQEAAQQVDTELALRLRFIARDLLANLNQPAEQAQAVDPSQLAPTHVPVAATTPLQPAALPTQPLSDS